jgi:hypothetical protein
MVTVEGTVRAAVVLPIATTTGLAAAWLSDRVQVLEALLPKVAGTQDSVLRLVEAVRVRVTVFTVPLIPMPMELFVAAPTAMLPAAFPAVTTAV